jgi:hypothetical protein
LRQKANINSTAQGIKKYSEKTGSLEPWGAYSGKATKTWTA